MSERIKLKHNIKEVPKRDRCQTPPYALDPLLPYIPKHMTVWEPAVGEGYLANEMIRKGYEVVGTDLCYSTTEDNQDFLISDIPEVDCIITNPPYSIKYEWIARCYEIELPFALLIPVDTIGAAKAQALFSKYGISILYMNQRIDFKMPDKGWSGSGSFFPTAWYTYKLLPEPIMFSSVVAGKSAWKKNLKKGE